MITSWSSGIPDANMDEDILIGLYDIVSRHPWWIARARLLLSLLKRLRILPPATIIEAGCGWGINFEFLEAAGYNITGLDISRKVLSRLDRADRQLIEADLTQKLPSNVPTYDCVLALDVIEHIDDDCAAIRELARLVKDDGRIVFSVPALPELYSEFDAIQGHRRRYTDQSLTSSLQRAGLAIEDVMWWGQWMTGLLRRQRTRQRGESRGSDLEVYRRYLQLPPWPAHLLMRAFFRVDHLRTLHGRNSTGTSLIAIAKLA
jgi:SAM-dependent methyltransferase